MVPKVTDMILLLLLLVVVVLPHFGTAVTHPTIVDTCNIKRRGRRKKICAPQGIFAFPDFCTFVLFLHSAAGGVLHN